MAMANLIRLSIILMLVFVPAVGHAADDLMDLYFSSGQNPKLTDHEKAALKVAEKWSADSKTAQRPTMGADGSVQFLFGTSQPSIVCAVLQVTDIELEPGEQVNTIHLGDTARWSVEPAITGSGNLEIMHLIVKAKDVGLETSMLVTTNRRSYHMRLKSHRSSYMPKVTFQYPDAIQAKWDALRKRDKEQREEETTHNTIAATGEYLGNLDFNYEISGSARWKPTRVYNDGTKTVIQMPGAMRQTEAPTLLVVRNEGGFFRDDEMVMVNYRLQGDRYVVDTLFDKAILIAGVGSNQDKVVILRKN